MQRTGSLNIHYYGEGTYNETTQVTADVFRQKGYFPQRRDQILGRLVERGNNVQKTLFSEKEINELVYLAVEDDQIIIADNPRIAKKLERVDVFDWIDWYSEMAAKEFGIEDIRTRQMKSAEEYVIKLDMDVSMIAQGPFIAQHLRTMGWNKWIKIIPNGVDTEIFKPSEPPYLNVGEPVELVFVGKLTTWYEGIWEFIIAIRNLDAVLHIYGAGIVADEIKERNPPNVVLHGAVPYEEVPNAMWGHDIAVFPVDDDSPCVIPEYLAVGLPIIGLHGNHGRLKALIDDRVGAVCTPDRIAHYINKFSFGPKHCSMSEECMGRGLLYRWENQAISYEEVLCSL